MEKKQKQARFGGFHTWVVTREPTSTRYISWGVGCPKGTVRHFHVLETLASLSPAVAPDLAVRCRSSSSHVWILAEVLYFQHFDDRGFGSAGSNRGTALHQDAASIIRNRASSGNPRGLLPQLNLGSSHRKSFFISSRPYSGIRAVASGIRPLIAHM